MPLNQLSEWLPVRKGVNADVDSQICRVAQREARRRCAAASGSAGGSNHRVPGRRSQVSRSSGRTVIFAEGTPCYLPDFYAATSKHASGPPMMLPQSVPRKSGAVTGGVPAPKATSDQTRLPCLTDQQASRPLRAIVSDPDRPPCLPRAHAPVLD